MNSDHEDDPPAQRDDTPFCGDFGPVDTIRPESDVDHAGAESYARITSKLPPAPSTPSELMSYPAKKPDWVDDLVADAARTAAFEVLRVLRVELFERLADFERTLADWKRTSDRNWELTANEVKRHGERLSAHDEELSRLKDQISVINRRLDGMPSGRGTSS